MHHYIIIYVGGDQPETPEEGKENFERYQKWLGELGEAAIRPMVPHMDTKTVGANRSVKDGSSSGISGHTIVQADSIEAAVGIAQTCPFLDMNGSLEVAEISSG